MTRAAALVTLLSALAAVLFFFDKGRPQPLADGASEKVACVSYAPYTREQTPFDAKLMIPPAQIERDLKALSAVTSCVRTYATGQGLDKAPEIASRLGMKVYAGAWIGRKDADNQIEIKRLLAAANAHPEAIKGLIVGNEVILRGEQTPEALIAYMNQVRAGLIRPLPITYADVWEFWERNPQLAQAADFVTIHLLPYWEDDPTPIDAAIRHVMAVWAKMRDEFASKPILIGEVGWPSEGRRREGAEPSLYNQTRFVREFITAAEKAGADYNLIEALDQPWKRELEGTVGGAWGFFDADRVQKVFTRGPVVEWPDAARWAGAALALGLLPLLFALIRREAKAAVLVPLVCGGFAAASALLLQTRHLFAASRGVEEWAINGGWLAFSAIVAWAVVRAAAGLEPGFRSPSLAEMRFASTVGMAVSSLGLLFNARYRDFPVSMFLIAAVGFALVRLPAAPREHKAVALLLAAASVGVLINEGWLNTHAWLWASAGCVLAAATLSGGGRTTPVPRG